MLVFCDLCKRDVQPRRYFNWPAFLLWNFTCIGGIFYLFWYMIKDPDCCPICKTSQNLYIYNKQTNTTYKLK